VISITPPVTGDFITILTAPASVFIQYMRNGANGYKSMYCDIFLQRYPSIGRRFQTAFADHGSVTRNGHEPICTALVRLADDASARLSPIAGMTLRLAAGVLSLAGALFLATPTTWARTARSNADVLANLETVLFGSEFKGEDNPIVRKWTAPWRVAVYGDDRGSYRGLLDAHLAHPHRPARLDIRIVERPDARQNVRVLFFGQSQSRDYVRRYLPEPKRPNAVSRLACLGLYGVNERNEIDWATAVIPTSLPRSEIKACIIEELTQVLGLPNDSFDIAP